MMFSVYSNNLKRGTLRFDNDIHHVDGDAELHLLVADIIRTGVTLMNDMVFHDARWIVNEPIPSNDLRFPIAVVDTLRRRGFIVHEEHPELEAQFESLLHDIPADAPLVLSIRRLWNTMSYLEKTDFLGTVRNEYIKQAV